TQRIATMQQQVLSRNRLQPMIDRLGLAKGRNPDDVMDEIRQNLTIQPVESDLSPASNKKRPGHNDVPGLYVNFTASDQRPAQQLVTELTSIHEEVNHSN